ncbi:MAG TPA: hypothetical protein PLM50_02405 [Rectinema sp.]|nr:hypothetical protein [Rectinema sp.]
MIKKETFIMTLEYDEEGHELLDMLNISEERAKYLTDLAEKTMEESGKGHDEPWDSFEALLDLMNSNELRGNEIFYYLINGYTLSIKMRMMMKENMKFNSSLKKMLKDFEEL